MLRRCNKCGSEIPAYTKTCPRCPAKKPFKSNFERKMDNVSSAFFRIGCGVLPALFCLFVVRILMAALFDSN